MHSLIDYLLLFYRSNNEQSNNQTSSAENLYNNNLFNNQQTNQDSSYVQQQTNYGDQVMVRHQPTYTNYSTPYQSEQSLNQQINQKVYCSSAPTFNNQLQDNTVTFSTSPIYQQQTQQIQNSEHQQQSNYLAQTNYNKVIEMPVLQSSMNLNEGIYQQMQQQKTFATSATNYTIGSNQSKQSYPWPLPKNS